MLKKGAGGAGTVPLLAQRAVADSPRWTRAVGIIPATPYKVIVCLMPRLGQGAALGKEAVLADPGWVGETVGLFEHPTKAFSRWATYVAPRSSCVPVMLFRSFLAG